MVRAVCSAGQAVRAARGKRVARVGRQRRLGADDACAPDASALTARARRRPPARPGRPARAQSAARPRPSSRQLLDDLQPDRALAGDHAARRLADGTSIIPSRSAISCARATRSSLCGPTKTISAPSARTPATFTAGALSGMTTTARIPEQPRGARHAPGAWLPLECVDDAAAPAPRQSAAASALYGAADLERAGRLEALRLEERAVAKRQQRRPQRHSAEPLGRGADVVERDRVGYRTARRGRPFARESRYTAEGRSTVSPVAPYPPNSTGEDARAGGCPRPTRSARPTASTMSRWRPGIETLDPADVDTLHRVRRRASCAIPILAAAMDAVVDAAFCGALARLGGLARAQPGGAPDALRGSGAGPRADRDRCRTARSTTPWRRRTPRRSARSWSRAASARSTRPARRRSSPPRRRPRGAWARSRAEHGADTLPRPVAGLVGAPPRDRLRAARAGRVHALRCRSRSRSATRPRTTPRWS